MKDYKRRNFYIPTELDEKINQMVKKFNYKSKKEMIIELLELGILKFDEDYNMKNIITRLINKIDYLVAKLDK